MVPATLPLHLHTLLLPFYLTELLISQWTKSEKMFIFLRHDRFWLLRNFADFMATYLYVPGTAWGHHHSGSICHASEFHDQMFMHTHPFPYIFMYLMLKSLVESDGNIVLSHRVTSNHTSHCIAPYSTHAWYTWCLPMTGILHVNTLRSSHFPTHKCGSSR